MPWTADRRVKAEVGTRSSGLQKLPEIGACRSQEVGLVPSGLRDRRGNRVLVCNCCDRTKTSHTRATQRVHPEYFKMHEPMRTKCPRILHLPAHGHAVSSQTRAA